MSAEYDFVIVGGGTAGCVLAARLSEDPAIKVCLIEGGPSDQNIEKVLKLRQWLSLLGSELDYDYPTTEQPNGNSFIRHSRAKVLGGCSSHNTLISFRPLPKDLEEWVALGCEGWDYQSFETYADRIKCHIQPIAQKDRNDLTKDWILAANKATGAPIQSDFHSWSKNRTDPSPNGVGFLSIAYTPENGHRSSASVAYMHPIMGKRDNLDILLETWCSKINLDSENRATSVEVRGKDGVLKTISARNEIILSAGAVDTPRLLLHSGVGPAKQLNDLGIPVKHDLPGVGENLLDHPESIIMWEIDEAPKDTVMDSDAGLFLRRDESDPRPDLMYHIYTVPFSENTERLGYDKPKAAVCMTPNIPRPKSVGRLYLTSADPSVKPALDFRYFTDPEGYDAKTIVDGLKIARKVAEQEPFKKWLKREVAPGPKVQTDEELSEYGRRAAHTVYHPAGTCKMGAANDNMAVVDPKLRIRGLKNIRIADASVFPKMVTANPMLTVLSIGERCSEFLKVDFYRDTYSKSRL